MNQVKIYGVTAATFILYILVGMYVLFTGHLHEDAYILYVYSESVAAGNGIAYFPGGSPAEGATDFLWMMVLGAGQYLGIDVAILAVILNGIGVAGVSFIAMKLASDRLDGVWLTSLGIGVTSIVVTSQVAQASYAGFSSGFYTFFIALIFFLLYRCQKETLHLIPVVGLALGLLRPDGVIVGVFASLIGMVLAYSNGVLRRFILVSCACFTVGLAYFVWRYEYFGLLLPLPLYIKSTSPDALPGLLPHLLWAKENAWLGLIAASVLIVDKKRWHVILAAIPVGMLFIAFIFATQSQNVSYRFQAPGTVLIIICAALFFSLVPRVIAPLGKLKAVPVVLLMLITGKSFVLHLGESAAAIESLQSRQYINEFPYYLSSDISNETVIALTEAGRFAYWMKGKKYDLVGLNTPEVALNKSSPDYISGLNPDIIFMHVAGLANYEGVCDKDVCQLSKQDFLDNRNDFRDWRDVNYGVHRAPLTVFEYVQGSEEEFAIFVANYFSKYSHVYVVRRGGSVNIKHFRDKLEKSFVESATLSYWDMKASRNWQTIFDE